MNTDRRKSSGYGGIFKEGDWKCNNCENINFSWRTKCNICKRSKSESGKSHSHEKKYENRNKRDEYRNESSRYKNHRETTRSHRRSERPRSHSLSESSLFSSKSLGSSNHRKGRKERRTIVSRDFSPEQNFENPNEHLKKHRSRSGSRKREENIDFGRPTNEKINYNRNLLRSNRSSSRSSNRSDSIHKMRFSEIEN